MHEMNEKNVSSKIKYFTSHGREITLYYTFQKFLLDSSCPLTTFDLWTNILINMIKVRSRHTI